jgi:hypothetical protein
MMIVRRALRHLSRISDVMFRKTLLEREITIFPDDVFLTSYPRSGNTWTRFLVGNLIYQDEGVNFLNVERLVPDMYKTADWIMRKYPRPRVMKSHECFDPRYPKVVYIVRDPRDVAVSNYNFELKLGSVRDGYPIEEFVPRWMNLGFWPRIGSWADHVNSWMSTRQGSDTFLLVRYEDLQQDTVRELTRVASFVGADASQQKVSKAVELSSAEHMRKMESTQGSKWVATARLRQDKPFVGKAKSGGWRTVLPEQTVAYMEEHWGPLMVNLGYELVSGAAATVVESSHARR